MDVEPRRKLSLIEATALNMSNMIGIGPFITIPLLMGGLAGPWSMLGWLVALAIAVSDGLIWAELGAALPSSGGSYHYLREAFGRERWGRLVAFLFTWQFIFSGPLEIASGYIGMASYLTYLWQGLSPVAVSAIAAGAGLVNIGLLYRPIHSVGRITVTLWAGTLLTAGAVILIGALRFEPERAFAAGAAVPAGWAYFLGLGAAARVGIYDYLGYYDVCYVAGEVAEPGRTIPRSILISVVAVALLYFAINLSVVGVIPWREFVPAESTRPVSDFVVSIFIERTLGPGAARVFTLLIAWTAFGSVFALLLGYSRIPQAAARAGDFFAVFAREHPRGGFPHVALLVVGVLSILASFASLALVIEALVTMRILVQFIGQAAAVVLLRRHAPALPRPFRLWLYPLPVAVALAGWTFLLVTTRPEILGFGLGAMVLGTALFLLRARALATWPFGRTGAGS